MYVHGGYIETSKVKGKNEDGDPKVITFVSGDIGRMAGRGVTLGALYASPSDQSNTILTAGLSLANTMGIATGIIRLVEAVNAGKALWGKQKGSNASKTEIVTQTALVGLTIGQAVAEVGGGVVGPVTSILTLDALTTASKASAVAGQSLGIASSGLALAFLTFKSVVSGIKAAKGLNVLKKLKDSENSLAMLNQLYKTKPSELKLVAPKAFAVIEKNGGALTPGEVDTVIKEARGGVVFSIIVISTCVISILSIILALVASAGIGVIIAAVISLIAALSVGSVDVYSMIEYLKLKTGLSTKDLVIKIITIILAAITLAVVLAFISTMPLVLAVVGVVIASLMLATPIVSIAIIKAKEARLIKEKKELAKRELIIEEAIREVKIEEIKVEKRILQGKLAELVKAEVLVEAKKVEAKKATPKWMILTKAQRKIAEAFKKDVVELEKLAEVKKVEAKAVEDKLERLKISLGKMEEAKENMALARIEEEKISEAITEVNMERARKPA